MITAKKKRWGGHWIMRDGEIIGEAWKMKGHNEFGMTIGGHFTNLPAVYWRNELPASWGFHVISERRLVDVIAIAEKHFGKEDVCLIA